MSEIDPLRAFGLLGSEDLAAPAPDDMGSDQGVVTGPPEPGELLGGRFRLVERIGQGGMGEVYRGRDEELEREVAIKLLSREGREVRERFQREAEATARVRHPNVIRIHESGQVRGHPYLVYELIEDSRDLSDAFAEASSLDERLDLLEQVAEGLAAAHAAGVVHRDLKPENVLVRATGEAVVSDFGLARIDRSSLTRSGSLLGTPTHMAPEQVRGEAATAAADVWALGLILHEAVYERHAFLVDSLDNLEVLLGRILESQVELPRTAPAPLRALLARSLAKDAAARPPDAGAFLEELRAARVERARPWPGPALAGVAALLLLVVGAGLGASGPGVTPAPETPLANASPPPTLATRTRPPEEAPSAFSPWRVWSHDVVKVERTAFVGEERLLLFGEEVALYDLSGRRERVYPPDFDLVREGGDGAYVSDSVRTYWVSGQGSPAPLPVLQRKAEDADPIRREIVVQRAGGVELRAEGTGKLLRRWEYPEGTRPDRIRLLPRHVVVVVTKPTSRLFVAPREGDEPLRRNLVIPANRLTRAAVSPDGKRVALGAANGMILVGSASCDDLQPLIREPEGNAFLQVATMAHLNHPIQVQVNGPHVISHTRPKDEPCEIVLWSFSKRSAISRFTSHKLRSLCVSPKSVLAYAHDQDVYLLPLWTIETLSKLD